MKITYNAAKTERKRLVNAIAHLLAVGSTYMGPPSFAYNIGGYIVDKDGNLVTPDEATKDDVLHLVDSLYAEYDFKSVEPMHELFPEEDETEPEEPIKETLEDADEAQKEPENDEEAAESDDTRLTLSLPKEKFSPAAIERLRALASSKQTLLKKVLNTDDLSIVVDDKQIMFPWFTLQGIDGEVDAYSKLVFLMAKRALTSSRISSYEKPTDNDKFTMRLFLNNLGFKGEEFKFARRFLVRNLEGNGAWRYGNAPDTANFDLDMPSVVTPNTSAPEPAEQTPQKEELDDESDVGNGEEESDDA